MTHKKNKRMWLKWVIAYVIFLACVFVFYYNSQNKHDFEKQYFQLVDIEYLDDPSYLENLYSQPDLITRLKNFNQELRNSNDFVFIEFSPIRLEFIEPNGKIATSFENITTTGQSAISIEGVMLDQVAFERYSLNIGSGELFSNEDFLQTNDNLPLLLGNDFKDYYSVGDTIPLRHYGETWNGVVKGFLKENEQIVQDSMIYHLDDYVLVPSFDSTTMLTGFTEEYQKRMHHSKMEGYVILNNKEGYKKAKKEIEDLSDKYNLSYQLLRGY